MCWLSAVLWWSWCWCWGNLFLVYINFSYCKYKVCSFNFCLCCFHSFSHYLFPLLPHDCTILIAYQSIYLPILNVDSLVWSTDNFDCTLDRYASAPKDLRSDWNTFTKDYFLSRSTLVSVFLLIDASIPAKAIDLEYASWLGQNQVFSLNIIHFQVLVSDKSSFWLLHFRTLRYSSWSLHSIDFFVGPHDINLYEMWQAEKEKEWREASRRKRERLSRVDTQFLPNNSTLDYDE